MAKRPPNREIASERVQRAAQKVLRDPRFHKKMAELRAKMKVEREVDCG